MYLEGIRPEKLLLMLHYVSYGNENRRLSGLNRIEYLVEEAYIKVCLFHSPHACSYSI